MVAVLVEEEPVLEAIVDQDFFAGHDVPGGLDEDLLLGLHAQLCVVRHPFEARELSPFSVVLEAGAEVVLWPEINDIVCP